MSDDTIESFLFTESSDDVSMTALTGDEVTSKPQAKDAIQDQQTKKLLTYAALGAGVVLLLLAIFIAVVIFGNRHIADSSGTTPSQEHIQEPVAESATEHKGEKETTPEEEAGVAELRELRSHVSHCAEAQTLATALEKYTRSIADTGQWTEDATKEVSTALDSIHTTCPMELSVDLLQAVQGRTFPAEVSEKITSGNWIPRVSPAPAGAITVDSFRSPTDNIGCDLSDPYNVTCTIYRYTAVPPQGCPLTQSDIGDGLGTMYDAPADAHIALDGSGSITCTGAQIASSTVLDYGHSATNGAFACRVDEAGVTCWNTINGSIFTLSRDAMVIQ